MFEKSNTELSGLVHEGFDLKTDTVGKCECCGDECKECQVFGREALVEEKVRTEDGCHGKENSCQQSPWRYL